MTKCSRSSFCLCVKDMTKPEENVNDCENKYVPRKHRISSVASQLMLAAARTV